MAELNSTTEPVTASHTPGPWHVSEAEIAGKRLLEVDSQFGVIAHVYGANTPDDETMPNAHLLAAAPDLLACLRRMCGMYGAYSRKLAPLLAEDEGTVWTFERANSLALEAIAKAEGRQS